MKESRNLLKWAILLLLALTWGSSFILMKKGLRTYDFYGVATLRLLWAAIVLLPLFIRSMKKIKARHWVSVVAVGVFGNGIPAFLFALAQNNITSSLSGMLNSLTPLFSLIIGFTFFKMKATLFQVIGIAMGLAGTYLLVQNGINYNWNPNILASAAIVVAATICYAISVNLIKFKLAELNAITITSGAFVSMLPWLLIMGLYFVWPQVNNAGTSATVLEDTLFIGTLGIIGTGLAVLLFNYLIKISNMLFATSVTYLIPIVAIGWGWYDNEIISVLDILGILIILSGVFLSNRYKVREEFAENN